MMEGLSRIDRPGPGSGDEISLMAVGNVLLENRRMVAGSTVFVAALVGIVTLLWPRDYTSRAAIAVEGPATPSGAFMGVAAQFGFDLSGDMAGESPEFYQYLFQSLDILKATVQTEYEFSDGEVTRSENLVEIFRVRGESWPKQREKAIRRLRGQMVVDVDRGTGVVSVAVRTRWPELSQKIVSRLLQLVEEFNIEKRQSRAAAERRFTSERLSAAIGELGAVEDTLQNFLEENRSFANSPALTFEYERLQRQLSLKQQVYSTLVQSHEQARIDEVRNTPVFTLVERPEIPTRPDRRHLAVKGLLGVIVGLTVGVSAAFGRSVLASAAKADPEGYERFVALKDDARQDLGGLLSWGRRRGSARSTDADGGRL